MMRDMMKLTLLFPVLADRITLFWKKKVRTESDSLALDLQNDYIIDSFGYYRDINFVQEDFQLEVIYKVRVIGLIVVVSQEVTVGWTLL